MIPLHPVAGDNPQQLRWVTSPDALPAVGTVRWAPGALGVLLHDGVIAELTIRATDMLLTLSDGNNWRHYGDQIREALSDALLAPDSWQIEAGASDAARLTEITVELLAGPIGDLAQSHGGSIELVSVTGNNVTVQMSGACHGCPAAASTLRDRLEYELRRRTGHQVTVSRETPVTGFAIGKKLLTLLGPGNR